jgi:hypothetical protein
MEPQETFLFDNPMCAAEQQQEQPEKKNVPLKILIAGS